MGFLAEFTSNFFHDLVLKSLMVSLKRFIRRDNPTLCATRIDGARVCLEVDASKNPISHLWISKLSLPKICHQEVVYETLHAYCQNCKQQGHNKTTCRFGFESQEKKKVRKVNCGVENRRIRGQFPTLWRLLKVRLWNKVCKVG